MGSIYAHGLSESADDGMISLEQAVTIHLAANHYPAVPTIMVPVCVSAINLANEGDQYFDALVDLPVGVSYRGQEKAPVREIIEAYHLDAFIFSDE